MLRPLVSRLSAVAVVCLLAGCGSSDGRSHVAPVKGKVTFKGEPLRTGSIIFVPDAGGKTAVADISREGEYVLGSYESTDGSHAWIISRAEEFAGVVARFVRDAGANQPLLG